MTSTTLGPANNGYHQTNGYHQNETTSTDFKKPEIKKLPVPVLEMTTVMPHTASKTLSGGRVIKESPNNLSSSGRIQTLESSKELSKTLNTSRPTPSSGKVTLTQLKSLFMGTDKNEDTYFKNLSSQLDKLFEMICIRSCTTETAKKKLTFFLKNYSSQLESDSFKAGIKKYFDNFQIPKILDLEEQKGYLEAYLESSVEKQHKVFISLLIQSINDVSLSSNINKLLKTICIQGFTASEAIIQIKSFLKQFPYGLKNEPFKAGIKKCISNYEESDLVEKKAILEDHQKNLDPSVSKEHREFLLFMIKSIGEVSEDLSLNFENLLNTICTEKCPTDHAKSQMLLFLKKFTSLLEPEAIKTGIKKYFSSHEIKTLDVTRDYLALHQKNLDQQKDKALIEFISIIIKPIDDVSDQIYTKKNLSLELGHLLKKIEKTSSDAKAAITIFLEKYHSEYESKSFRARIIKQLATLEIRELDVKKAFLKDHQRNLEVNIDKTIKDFISFMIKSIDTVNDGKHFDNYFDDLKSLFSVLSNQFQVDYYNSSDKKIIFVSHEPAVSEIRSSFLDFLKKEYSDIYLARSIEKLFVEERQTLIYVYYACKLCDQNINTLGDLTDQYKILVNKIMDEISQYFIKNDTSSSGEKDLVDSLARNRKQIIKDKLALSALIEFLENGHLVPEFANYAKLIHKSLINQEQIEQLIETTIDRKDPLNISKPIKQKCKAYREQIDSLLELHFAEIFSECSIGERLLLSSGLLFRESFPFTKLTITRNYPPYFVVEPYIKEKEAKELQDRLAKSEQIQEEKQPGKLDEK